MTQKLYDKLIDALFEAYCDEDNDYPKKVRNQINDTIKYFSDALQTTPAKVDYHITAPISEVEHWAFEQGFNACLELIGNSLLRRNEHEKNKG